MKRKIVIRVLAAMTGAMLSAGVFATGVSAPATTVEAASYSTMQAIRNAFDANFYANKYSDVKKAYGTNADALFQHFSTYGMSEGRMLNSNFDPKAYIDAYADIRAYCNGDIRKAYEHYVEHGMYENRNLTTYEALNRQRAADAAKNQQQKKTTPTPTPPAPKPRQYDPNYWMSCYNGDEWIWAYYDIYGTFPSWINYQDNGEWDYRLLKAYIDHYGTLPNQKNYGWWNWDNAYWRLYGNNYGNNWGDYSNDDALALAWMLSIMN